MTTLSDEAGPVLDTAEAEFDRTPAEDGVRDGAPRPWSISEVRAASPPSFVSATVSDAEMWFESNDADLSRSPEAFATAMFVPALHFRRQVCLEDPVDAGWVENTKRILPIYVAAS